MKTAVIYARYSCEKQTEQSIEGQLRVCEEYAKSHDILIVDTYIDEAMSGTNDNRPNFQQMLRDSNKREWNYVLVYKLDRFSRNKYESVIHKRTLKDNCVSVLSAMENIPDSPEGIILESLLEGMNQYFSAELAQKVKRGMKETRIKGNFQGGHLLYGYQLNGSKIIINENEALTVKYLFERYNAGACVRIITKELSDKGITNRGKPFAKTTLYKMLKNEKYTGTYQHEDEIISNMYPRIISDELFNSVKAKCEKNHYGRKSIKTVYLLRNKLFCGYCGKPMTAECGTSKHDVVMRYYKCSNIKRFHNHCQKTTIPKDKLENFIIDVIIQKLQEPQTMNSLLDYLMQIQNNSDNSNTALKILERQQKTIQNNLDNIMKAVEQGIINKTTNKRMQELEEQIETLERKIIIERSKTATKLSREKLKQYYQEALKQEPARLINLLIKQIQLYNDRMIIFLNSPIKTSPDANQGFLRHIVNTNIAKNNNLIVDYCL